MTSDYRMQMMWPWHHPSDTGTNTNSLLQMSYLPVYIVLYHRDKDPYHWSIFVKKDAEALDGAVFDIQKTLPSDRGEL
jgi:hypothetical protein